MLIPPRREAEFVPWLTHLHTLVAAEPATYGVPAAVATEFTAAFTAFIAANNEATNPQTRTKAAIEGKNAARAVVTGQVRHIIGIIQSMPSVSNQQRIDLGLNVRDTSHTPVPPPSESPVIVATLEKDRRILVKLKGTGPRNGRPAGVSGATVFTHVGAEPPADTAAWQFATNTGKMTLTLNFASTTAAQTVWITAFWFNPRKESGPATQPISINLPAATAVPQGVKLKIAA